MIYLYRFLDGNSISKVEGLEGCIQLEELHLSNQKVAPGHNLSIGNNTLHSLSRTLEVLNVEGSKVKAVSPFCILGQLKTLQAANNQLEHLDVSFPSHLCFFTVTYILSLHFNQLTVANILSLFGSNYMTGLGFLPV